MLPHRAREMKSKWLRQGLELPDDKPTTISFTDQDDITDTKTSIAEEDKGPFPFFRLPFELRKIVFEFVVGHPIVGVFLPGYNGQRRTYLPMAKEVTRVRNRQYRLEGLRVVIANTDWCIHSGPGNWRLQEWLGNVKSINFKEFDDEATDTDAQAKEEIPRKTGFDYVRYLSFDYFSSFPFRSLHDEAPNNDIELMRRCRNLREITLTWRWGSASTETVEELRAEYRLDGLLDLKMLKRVTVFDAMVLTTEGRTSLGDMLLWLKKALAVQNQRVEIDFGGKILEELVEDDSTDDDGADDDGADVQ